MAWIESHQEIGRHPKTKKLARRLAVSVPTAVGHLHLLWHWALDFAEDGSLEPFESWELADAAMWDGDPDEFVSALADVGFVDRTERGSELHDWLDYAGKLIEQRQMAAERARRNRGLYNDDELRRIVRARDGDCCRYCGVTVNWRDRKSATGGTYDHVDPTAQPENTPENVVVACRACSAKKNRRSPEDAGMHLLSPADHPPSTADNLPLTVDHGRSPGAPSTVNLLTVPNRTVPNQDTGTNVRASADAPAPASDPDPDPKPRKPRTPKQQAADRKYERTIALFDAYCRGIGIDPASEAAAVYRDRAFRELKPVVSKSAPDPDDMERCTRWMTLQDWRDEPPKISQVLGSYAGWVSKGKPDVPEKSSNVRPFPNRGRDRSWVDKWRQPANVIDVESRS